MPATLKSKGHHWTPSDWQQKGCKPEPIRGWGTVGRERQGEGLKERQGKETKDKKRKKKKIVQKIGREREREKAKKQKRKKKEDKRETMN